MATEFVARQEQGNHNAYKANYARTHPTTYYVPYNPPVYKAPEIVIPVEIRTEMNRSSAPVLFGVGICFTILFFVGIILLACFPPHSAGFKGGISMVVICGFWACLLLGMAYVYKTSKRYNSTTKKWENVEKLC